MSSLHINILDHPASDTTFAAMFRTVNDTLAVRALLAGHAVTTRALALLDGRLAGIGILHQQDVPDGVTAGAVLVTADLRGRGVGTAISRTLLTHAASTNATAIEAHVDAVRGNVGWARHVGFDEYARRVTSVLPLTSSHPGTVPSAVTFHSLHDLLSRRESHAVWRQFHTLLAEIASSIPDEDGQAFSPEEVIPFGQGDPLLDPHVTMIALHHDEWVGLCLVRRIVPGERHVGMTGVRTAWRSRGVARALKHAMHARAMHAGARCVTTDNDARNTGMLALNASLGYRLERTTVRLRRALHRPVDR